MVKFKLPPAQGGRGQRLVGEGAGEAGQFDPPGGRRQEGVVLRGGGAVGRSCFTIRLS